MWDEDVSTEKHCLDQGIHVTVPGTACGFGITIVNSEPSGFITNIPLVLWLAICLPSGAKLANRFVDCMFVICVILPPVTGTDHQSEGTLCAFATVTPITLSSQLG